MALGLPRMHVSRVNLYLNDDNEKEIRVTGIRETFAFNRLTFLSVHTLQYHSKLIKFIHKQEET